MFLQCFFFVCLDHFGFIHRVASFQFTQKDSLERGIENALVRGPLAKKKNVRLYSVACPAPTEFHIPGNPVFSKVRCTSLSVAA